MQRRNFIKNMAALPFLFSTFNLNQFEKMSQEFEKTEKLPVLFIGHGHPMNALLDNDFTKRLKKLGQNIEKPKAVLMISAHWETRGTYVSTNPSPKTIYDFGRFDDRLFDIKYEPQGHPELAKLLQNEVSLVDVKADPNMGLDHGAWTVLKFIFPQQDVPVFQLSMDRFKGADFHYKLGQQLKKLREKGVLIIGSGNIVHNLYEANWSSIEAPAHDWNIEFDTLVKEKIDARNFESLVSYQKLGAAAQKSIPTPDHYHPFVYTLGVVDKNESIQHIFEGYQSGSISMRCVQFG